MHQDVEIYARMKSLIWWLVILIWRRSNRAINVDMEDIYLRIGIFGASSCHIRSKYQRTLSNIEHQLSTVHFIIHSLGYYKVAGHWSLRLLNGEQKNIHFTFDTLSTKKFIYTPNCCHYWILVLEQEYNRLICSGSLQNLQMKKNIRTYQQKMKDLITKV